MAFKSALIYWFLDKVPRPMANSYEKLRVSKRFNMDIAEDSACDAVWTAESGQSKIKKEEYLPCVVFRLDAGKIFQRACLP